MAAAPLRAAQAYEEEKEDIVSVDKIKDQLNYQLNAVNSAGLFAHYEQLKHAPNPGIRIEGAGTVSFSSTERDCQMIITASGQARDDNGILRSVWEVPADKVRVGNPSWNRLVFDIAGVDSVIVEQLGIDAVHKGIFARVPSLILYQPGSVVKAPDRSNLQC